MFRRGLEAAGFNVADRYEQNEIHAGDIVVMWNRKPNDEHIAAAFEIAGARVLVCENGYVTPDSAGRNYFAISIGGHNGSGTPLAMGGSCRWDRLEMPIAPMSYGEKILICSQRGIGASGMAMPANWLDKVRKKVEGWTDRTIEIRKPPSRLAHQPFLEEQLADAWAVVVWTSNVATAALLHGTQVFLEGPHHVMESACIKHALVNSPATIIKARQPAFERMAWFQWSEEEIAKGTPFEYLHSDAPQRGRLPAH
jgi:hypothetical protein